jgi:hypothetical protein
VKNATAAFLDASSNETKILRSIIRGHQHIGKAEQQLRGARGLYRLGKELS